MFMQHEPSGALVEVLSLEDLYNPCHATVAGRFHAGEEMQDPEPFTKSHLVFPSGESLPRCWVDVHYREKTPQHKVAIAH